MSYSARLLEGGSLLTRLAHRRRYDQTLGLISGVRGATVLDFGCGDALLLKRAHDRGIACRGFAVDADAEMRSAAGATLASTVGFSVLAPDQLKEQVAPHSCDVALCTETLEQVARPAEVMDALCAYVKPGGYVLITVPIEIGPALIGKQVGRFLAGAVSEYGYERYSSMELVLAALLWRADSFASSHTGQGDAERGHKGFDFRRIEQLIRERLTIERTVCTPFPAMGPLANSTIMWLCRAD